MKVQLNLLATAVLLAVGCAHAGELRNAHAPNAIPGRYIVVFKDGSSQSTGAAAANVASAQNVASAMGKRFGARIERTYTKALRGALMEMNHAQAERLAQDPEVAFVEPDMMMYASATQSNATWGLDRIDQTALPLNRSYTYPSTASGVHAYIIDTGIRASHSDFSGRIGNGYDAIRDGYGTNDCGGHGTHVAGTVGGTTWGVAKGVILHPVRVLGCDGSGSTSGIIAAMDWVAQNHVKPAVANMSLGGGASSSLDSAISRLVSAGVTTVVAAGNDSSNACNYSPARAPSAITVGSTASNDYMSNFSNYGSCVDIYAPGSNIVSASSSSNTGSTSMSGTSMASPHVAGAAALYLASNRSATPAQVTSALLAQAQNGRISGIPSGVNKMLYVGNIGGGGGDTTPPDDDVPTPGGKTFSVDVPYTYAGRYVSYNLSVPSGAKNLRIAIAGGYGDADLYVKYGSVPTTTSYSCRPFLQGNNESCTAATPTAGTHYIMIRAYTNFSGVKLTASYE